MDRYYELHNKLKNKTITKNEKKELMVLAFGEDFMNDKNPNKKWRV